MELSDVIFGQYAHVAGLGAMMELQMRLLASRTPELAPYAHDKGMDGLEQRIHAHFDSKMKPNEKEFLREARGLRNKLLHGDFKAAATKASGISGAPASGPSVYAIKLSSSEVKPVSTMTKREAGVFGWMLECLQTGVFKEAEEIFLKANEIYRRLTFEAATEGLDQETMARLGFPSKTGLPEGE